MSRPIERISSLAAGERLQFSPCASKCLVKKSTPEEAALLALLGREGSEAAFLRNSMSRRGRPQISCGKSATVRLSQADWDQLLDRETGQNAAQWMRVIRYRVDVSFVRHKAARLQFRQMPGKRASRDMRSGLHANKGICSVLDGAIHFYPARMSESSRQFEEHIRGVLPLPPQKHPQSSGDHPTATFSRDGHWPVFDTESGPPARQQPPCFQRAQVLAGGRKRQLHLPGDAGDRLARLTNQQSEHLQALPVSEDTAGAPERWLASR
jgi:hypothetical protein